MSTSQLLFSVITGLFLIFTSPVKAQIPDLNTEVDSDEIYISFWGGYSFNSVRFLGKTPDSQTTIFGLGIEKLLKEYPNGSSLYYSAGIIPYVRYDYPKRDDAWKKNEVSGWGLSPVGFLMIKPISENLHPFLQTTGGFIYTEHTFPTDLSRRLNYTFDITFGTRIQYLDKNILTLGYKFHHISNAQTGSENPGLDSNFLYLSFSF